MCKNGLYRFIYNEIRGYISFLQQQRQRQFISLKHPIIISMIRGYFAAALASTAILLLSFCRPENSLQFFHTAIWLVIWVGSLNSCALFLLSEFLYWLQKYFNYKQTLLFLVVIVILVILLVILFHADSLRDIQDVLLSRSIGFTLMLVLTDFYLLYNRVFE